MDLTAAALLAMSLNFFVYATAAVWYFMPWSKTVSLAKAVTPLVWVHAFRTIALQLFSSQEAGYAIADSLRDEIIWGDQIGFAVAVVLLYLLRFRKPAARVVGWIFVTVTVVDLLNALVGGISEELLGQATDVSFMILTFYVPMLWVSTAFVGFQLWTRRSESIA